MRSTCAGVALVALVAVAPAAAQGPLPPAPPDAQGASQPGSAPAPTPPAAAPDSSEGSFLSRVGRDFKTFFTSEQTAWTVGTLSAGALVASPWDERNARVAHTSWPEDAFETGKVSGNVLTHLAAGTGTYLIGRAASHDGVAALGRDVVRSQILSQSVVQAAKMATQRNRPDGSNSHSLPSGHTATAFATAGVLHRHFGWKAAIPGYAFATWVGASRMQAHRHYLSDVIVGAGIGLASAFAVTVDLGPHRVDMAAAPTPGGAALMFTAR